MPAVAPPERVPALGERHVAKLANRAVHPLMADDHGVIYHEPAEEEPEPVDACCSRAGQRGGMQRAVLGEMQSLFEDIARPRAATHWLESSDINWKESAV